MLSTNKAHAWFLIVGMTLFTIVGLIAGSPRAISFDTFGDFLRGFTGDMKTRLIFGAIFGDVITGVMAALVLGIFDVQQLAKFYLTNVLPYVLGYMFVWTGVYFGMPFPDVLNDTLASICYAAIMTTLSGSIADNIKRTRLGASPPEDVAMVDQPVTTGEG